MSDTCLIADIIKRKGPGGQRQAAGAGCKLVDPGGKAYLRELSTTSGNIVEYITDVEVEDVISTEGRVVTRTADYVATS